MNEIDTVTAYRGALLPHWAGVNDEVIRDYVRMQFFIALHVCHGIDPIEAELRAMKAEIVLSDEPPPKDETVMSEMPLSKGLTCLN